MALEKNIHIRVSARMYNILSDYSKKSGFTVAWLVRHATERYLSKKGLIHDYETSASNL